MQNTKNELKEYEQKWLDAGADEVVLKPMTAWGRQTDTFDSLVPDDGSMQVGPRRPNPCLNLWQSVTIAWDGRVVPCCFDYDCKQVIGNINSETPDDIWNGEKHVEMRRAEISGRNDCSLCRKCQDAPMLQLGRNFEKKLSRQRVEYLFGKSLFGLQRMFGSSSSKKSQRGGG